MTYQANLNHVFFVECLVLSYVRQQTRFEMLINGILTDSVQTLISILQ